MSGLFAGTPLERPVTCARCERALADCRCPRDAAGRVALPKDQAVRVRRETGGRGGKTVTVIFGLDPVASDLDALLKEIKTALGAGGAVKLDGEPRLEIQGNHRERVIALLNTKGYPAKAAGG